MLLVTVFMRTGLLRRTIISPLIETVKVIRPIMWIPRGVCLFVNSLFAVPYNYHVEASVMSAQSTALCHIQFPAAVCPVREPPLCPPLHQMTVFNLKEALLPITAL